MITTALTTVGFCLTEDQCRLFQVSCTAPLGLSDVELFIDQMLPQSPNHQSQRLKEMLISLIMFLFLFTFYQPKVLSWKHFCGQKAFI